MSFDEAQAEVRLRVHQTVEHEAGGVIPPGAFDGYISGAIDDAAAALTIRFGPMLRRCDDAGDP